MHSRVLLLVHVVWSTKLRQRVLSPDADGWLAGVAARKAVQAGCRVLACGNDSDHVHVLVRYPSTVTVASVVQSFKGGSSYEWNARRAPGRLGWQEGYWAESVSPEAIVGLIAYIEGQREHHSKPSASEPWESNGSDDDFLRSTKTAGTLRT